MGKALNVDEAARLLGVSPRSLGDRRYRERIGLAARRVGRRIVFARADLVALLERRENFARAPGQAG